ncbi:MAG: signal peptidase I [Paludibacter sp.]|nr:signal peptidase I [Paludibacter sp.]
MKDEKLNNYLLDFAETLLEDNNSIRFRMKGFSMYPTLKEGDVGLVEKCSANDLKKGDIVVFKSYENLVAHRLIKIKNQNGIRIFIAKGDKNPTTDKPFTAEKLIGKLVSFQRNNKTINTKHADIKFRNFISTHFSKIVTPFYNYQLRIENYFNKAKGELKLMKNNLSIVSENARKIIFTNAIIAVFQGVLPFVVIVCIKLFIDHLTGFSAQNESKQLYFIALLIITALVFLFTGILSEIRGYFSEKLSQTVTRTIYDKLHAKHASLDLSYYENPVEQDKIHRAVQEASYRPIKMINELLSGLRSVAAGLFMVSIFFTIKWYLVVLLLIAIVPGVLFRLKYSRRRYRLKKLQSTREREMYYYSRILTGFPFAKEMRLFGFSTFFLQRFSKVQDTLFTEKIYLKKSELWSGIVTQTFAVLLIFVSLAYVSYLKYTGEISIGTVVLFFFAFQRGYAVLNELFMSATQILEDNTFMNDFTGFLDLPSKLEPIVKLPFTLNTEIRFENVSFRYETSKRDALSHVNITIPHGKTVAFAGANGSGKTTMIKLLCGFYQPDAGSISFDGTDAISIGRKTICENITAVFQDFALYNITALGNIGLGNIDINIDLSRAKNAALAAGIDDIIEKLPNGYNTLLGVFFEGGEELSIGQWQKVAIARAFYRDSPLILMDEPSSALDAVSEKQIIDSLKKLSHRKTSVIISHRLTTVQWADIIYFFEKGEVVESGSHTELMALGGKYFEMFQTANQD